MIRPRDVAGVAFVMSVGVAACRPEGAPGPRPASSAAPRASATPESGPVAAIRRAELSRTSAAVPDAALNDRDVLVRRAAARALARIADARAAELLGGALADEDPEVVAWAAFGLGATCEGHEARTVRALVARAASLGEGPPPPRHRFAMPPLGAITDALGRCGSAAAEQTLSAWLEGPRARAEGAALALGRLAGKRHRLDDASIVALLGAAARKQPVDGALYPFSRLESLADVSKKRLLDVATSLLSDADDQHPRANPTQRTFAIRALLPAGAPGFALLGRAIVNEHFPPGDRSIAAVTLGRLGPEAQPVLSGTLDHLAPAGTPLDARWLARTFAPLSAVLSALDQKKPDAVDALARLSDLTIPVDTDAAMKRRFVAVRCGAAAALAGTASQSTRLVRCDPAEHGRAGALATLRVLDRGELEGPRLAVWNELAKAADPAVRRAALGLLLRHPEATDVTDVLVQALGAKEPGVVAQAARALSDAPKLGASPAERAAKAAAATGDAKVADARIVEALAHALDAERPPDQIETRVALASAAASVGALSLKARVERYCSSDNVTLRRGAEIALRSLGSGATCPPPRAPGTAAPPGPQVPLTLTFVTDAGRLGVTLDPSLAPAGVDRIVSLARGGFYDHVAVHRVLPGSVVQLGDPTGDGSGGSGKAPVPSETSPVEFGSYAVGLALGGRDTGSSQIFVTLSPEPHLYGDYPVLGWADPEWSDVAEGDVVQRVEVYE